jgi:hypothetical protein
MKLDIPAVDTAASPLTGTYFFNPSVTVSLNANYCPGQRSFKFKAP